jgi:hypothetical protein
MEKVAFSPVVAFGAGRDEISFRSNPGEKTACLDDMIPSVREFLFSVRPEKNTRYALVNAMGAHEYWGPNSNNDAWPEAALCHLPPGWKGVPAVDKVAVKNLDWPYGLPTFYLAHAFCHHVNRDPAKKVGDVVFADWNDGMKRVELVMRLEKDLLYRHNGSSFWEQMEKGLFPAVSMGSRVPWDACSICLDEETFYRALATFNPQEHKHPGIAVLRWHERLIRETGKGIQGIARTRAEYCACMRYRAGTIDAKTGKKVFVFNWFPRFFDISLVGVGADKTAYKMISLGHGDTLMSKTAAVLKGKKSMAEAEEEHLRRTVPSLQHVFQHALGGHDLHQAFENHYNFPLRAEAKLAEYRVFSSEEVAEKEAELEVARREKAAAKKRAEISKEVDGVVTHVTKGEADLPEDLLHDLADKEPLPKLLGSLGSAGIVLRPREFMRVVLRPSGAEDLADGLHLPACPFAPPMHLDLVSDLSRLFARLISRGLFAGRSGFDEPLRERVGMTIVLRKKEAHLASPLVETSLPADFLSKMASLYASYRSGLMEFLPTFQNKLSGEVTEGKIASLRDASPESLFTPLSYRYFQKSFLDELRR